MDWLKQILMWSRYPVDNACRWELSRIIWFGNAVLHLLVYYLV